MWSYRTDGDVDTAPVFGTDNAVYVGSADNNIYAFQPTGALKWSYAAAQYSFDSSPALGANGELYIGSDNDNLFALRANGKFFWSYEAGFNVDSSPALDRDGRVAFGSVDNNMYLLSPAGKLIWSYYTRGDVDSSPAIGADGTVYFGSGDNVFYSLFGNTPTPTRTPTPTKTPTWKEQLAFTSFETSAGSDPFGYTLSGQVPDNPGTDAWGSTARNPRSGSRSFAAQDCSASGRCTFTTLDVSSYSGVIVRLWLASDGIFEGGDYARAYVEVDGAQKPYFVNLSGGALNNRSYGLFSYKVPEHSRRIKLVYEVKTSANNEIVYIDDVQVTANGYAPVVPPTATPVPPIIIRPGKMQTGEQFGYTLVVNDNITSTFDFYLFVVAPPPLGPYTLNLRGGARKGINALVQGKDGFFATPFQKEITSAFRLPQAVRGKNVTFYCVVVEAGKKPPVKSPGELSSSTPYVIMFHKANITVGG
jgi:hypothetical protein